MPAQRLEQRVPTMKNKGRVRAGADADLAIFDSKRVTDKATFTDAAQHSEGIEYVVVNGVVVVKKGELQSAKPGQAVRAPVTP
jgi:N-acyl-D-aspartate/D-glutamate deacylase